MLLRFWQLCVLSPILHCWGISRPVLITKTTIYSRTTMTAAYHDPYSREKKYFNEGRGRGCIVGLNKHRTFHSGCVPGVKPNVNGDLFQFGNAGLLCYITYAGECELLTNWVTDSRPIQLFRFEGVLDLTGDQVDTNLMFPFSHILIHPLLFMSLFEADMTTPKCAYSWRAYLRGSTVPVTSVALLCGALCRRFVFV